MGMAETFLGRPHSASGWGCRPVDAIYPPYLYVGHEGRSDHLGLSTVVESVRRGRWRGPQEVALLIWARCKTRILPSLHFSLWPLPLSAAPCLGKMRVHSARWRVPWL